MTAGVLCVLLSAGVSCAVAFQPGEHKKQERHLLPDSGEELCSRQPRVVLLRSHRLRPDGEDAGSRAACPGSSGRSSPRSADLRVMGSQPMRVGPVSAM